MKQVLQLLRNEHVRDVLAWGGAGLATLTMGAWAVFKHWKTRKEPSCSSSYSSVSIIGDVTSSPISIGVKKDLKGMK